MWPLSDVTMIDSLKMTLKWYSKSTLRRSHVIIFPLHCSLNVCNSLQYFCTNVWTCKTELCACLCQAHFKPTAINKPKIMLVIFYSLNMSTSAHLLVMDALRITVIVGGPDISLGQNNWLVVVILSLSWGSFNFPWSGKESIQLLAWMWWFTM